VTGTDVLNIDGGFAPGDVNVSIAGNAGVTAAEVLVAKAEKVTATTISDITTLSAGNPNQRIATITITESIAGALKANGKFRMVLPDKVAWASRVPTVPTTTRDGDDDATGILTSDVDKSFDGNDDSGDFWEFELDTADHTNDTLWVKVPSQISTEPTVVPLTGLRVDVLPGAASGELMVSIWNDDAGLLGSNEIIACIGSCSILEADPTDVNVSEGEEYEVTLTGGVGDLFIETAPDADVATAVLEGHTLTITGLVIEEEGVNETSVVVSDSRSNPQTVTVNITVIDFTVDPDEIEVGMEETESATIIGGTAPYTVSSSDDAVATATVSVSETDGNKLMVTGVAVGDATITVTDDADNTVVVSVTVIVLPSLGLVGIDSNGELVDTTDLNIKIRGGASSDDFDSVGDSFALDDVIDIKLEIEVAEDDVGEEGDIYIVAVLQVPGIETMFWFFQVPVEGSDQYAWAPWDGDFDKRQPYEVVDALQETHEVIVVEGLTGFPGNYMVFMAYENADGTIYWNETPLSFTVEAAEEVE
jgi:hypothetical protein